jgi:hypothetical protein
MVLVMTLRVPYGDFAAAAVRFHIAEAYVCAHAGATEVTGMMKETGRILFARTDVAMDTVRAELTEKGIKVFDGIWSAETPELEERMGTGETYIAAVAYHSEDAMPGVWIDAYPFQPSPVQVLRALYDEFRDTGELADVPFEEFVRLGTPNVVISGPKEIEGYAAAKSEG